jgi:hypothetical protein
MGFYGSEKDFNQTLFEGLYRGSSTIHFLEISKLKDELLLLQEKLKDPSN